MYYHSIYPSSWIIGNKALDSARLHAPGVLRHKTTLFTLLPVSLCIVYRRTMRLVIVIKRNTNICSTQNLLQKRIDALKSPRPWINWVLLQCEVVSNQTIFTRQGYKKCTVGYRLIRMFRRMCPVLFTSVRMRYIKYWKGDLWMNQMQRAAFTFCPWAEGRPISEY
jgi:hypothetical protein